VPVASLALLASANTGFIHSKLRNFLGRDTAEKLVLVETNYLQFTVNAILDANNIARDNEDDTEKD
jgi:hypothetical protein